MELLDKDRVTSMGDVSASPSLNDNTTSNAISSVARILGKATRAVVEDMKKPLKVPKKVKGMFTRGKSVLVSPEETTQELAEKEEILQKEIEARRKAEAKAIEAERLRVEIEQQARQAIEARLIEEQEAREAAEKRAAEAEATAQQERQIREQLEAKLEEEIKGEPEARKKTADVESLRGGIAGKDVCKYVLIDNAKKELNSEDVEVRCAAIRALRQLGNISVPILVETLSKDPSDDVRLDALVSLVELSDKSTLSAFIKCLKDDNPRIRLEAVRGLYQVGHEDPVPFLIQALKAKHDDVRRCAAAYLGRVRSETVAPALISLLQNSATTTREAAIISLSNIAGEAAIPHLIEALADESVVVRKAALQALRRITKQSFDFREEMPVDDERNRQAIGKWRKWWSGKKDKL